MLKTGKLILSTFMLLNLAISPVFAYYHKFIAENSGTRKTRAVLNAIFNQPTYGSGYYNTFNRVNYHNERSFSHVLFLGTPKSILERTATANQRAIANKEKMLNKKKTQKRIDKELKKQPFMYSTVEIPLWDQHKGVSIFVTALSKGKMFNGKKASSKIPVDINILDSNNKVVCSSTDNLKALKLSESEMKYVQIVYMLDRLLGDDTIYIKYYDDPKCLLNYKAEKIAIEYKTEKGKPIHTSIEMDFFKQAIKRDFSLI